MYNDLINSSRIRLQKLWNNQTESNIEYLSFILGCIVQFVSAQSEAVDTNFHNHWHTFFTLFLDMYTAGPTCIQILLKGFTQVVVLSASFLCLLASF